MDAYFNNFGGFGPTMDRRRRHPFGPERHFGPFGPHHGRHGFPPMPFGPHGGRGGFGSRGRGGFGPGGFGPWGPHHFGPRPEEDSSSSSSSSSEDEEPKKKKPEEETSSDSSSSDSEVDCHRRGRRGHGRDHRRKHHGRDRRHCHGHDRRHGRHARHPFWPPHHHHRGHFWPPHHHHHWDPRAQQEEELPVEDASQLGFDFQVVNDDVAAQMNNLQLQDEGPQDRSTKKWFKVALNAEGFKVKDIRIRLHQNKLLVEGKQNIKNALGTFQRSFAYGITVPAGVDAKKMKTKLGPDGILRIKAKKLREETDNDEVQVITVDE